MDIAYDPDKDRLNKAKHGVSLALAEISIGIWRLKASMIGATMAKTDMLPWHL